MVETLPFVSWLVYLLLYTIQGISGQTWKVNITNNHICAVRGSSVVMPCSFTHPPGLNITKVFWTINSKPNIEPTDLLDMPKYKGRVEYSPDIDKNCSATLREVKLTDAGEYRPRIVTKNAEEKWLHQPGFSLTVTDLSVHILSPVIQGTVVTVRCNHSCRLKDNAAVTWTRNGEDLPFNEANNPLLILVNVTVEDEGYYSCAMKDSDGHPSPEVKLNVMFPPRKTSASVSPSGEISEGTTVTLTCSSDANPPVQSYTWFKMDESTPVGSGQQYNIIYISSEDEGQYYCEARNKYGAENSTILLMTIVERPQYMAFVIIGILILGIVILSCSIYWVRRRSSSDDFQRPVKSKDTSADDVKGVDQECSVYANANISLLRFTHRGRSGDEDTQSSIVSKAVIVSSADSPRGTSKDCQTQYATVNLPRPACSSSVRHMEQSEIYCTVENCSSSSHASHLSDSHHAR